MDNNQKEQLINAKSKRNLKVIRPSSSKSDMSVFFMETPENKAKSDFTVYYYAMNNDKDDDQIANAALDRIMHRSFIKLIKIKYASRKKRSRNKP